MKSLEYIPACNQCAYENNSIFRFLNDDQLSLLSYEKGCNLYKKGNVVYHEGGRVNGFYCVNIGIVKLYKTGYEGREQIIRFAKQGEIIGFRSVLSGDFACHTARILEDSLLCFIPTETLFELIRKNAEFSIELLKLTCRELGEANAFITDIAQKTVRERLAEVLLILYNGFGLDEEKFLQIVLTREELSNIVGTATESVIRLLSELKEDKLIEIHGRRLKLLDLRGLKKVANY
ncbi:MAG: Crp/Fnr family transcriptional regulator [Bacteroidetes bacterium HGW-Bacteroidetes-21]|nr:MAG: Crp/Fnr family transcriptional regulator [Bacteroidetes bacterium HGW-Bacteroidetes-21]